MSTVLPDDHFLSSPRAPRAQFLADRIRARANSIASAGEITEQNKLGAMQEAALDLKSRELSSSEGL